MPSRHVGRRTRTAEPPRRWRSKRRWALALVAVVALAVLAQLAYGTLYLVHHRASVVAATYGLGAVTALADAVPDGSWEICCSHSVSAEAGHLRFELRASDDPVAGGWRSELALRRGAFGRDERYCFDVRLPAAYADRPPVTIAQWHAIPDRIFGEGGRPPPLRIVVADGRWHLALNEDPRWLSGLALFGAEPLAGRALWTGPVRWQAWTRWCVEVRWDPEGGGRIHARLDDAVVADWRGTTGYRDLLAPYFKLGVYVPQADTLPDAHWSADVRELVVDLSKDHSTDG